MSRRAVVLALLVLGLLGCSATRDAYVGSDGPSGVAPSELSGQAGAPQVEPVQVSEPPEAEVDAGPVVSSDPPPPSCQASHEDCDRDPRNGCEADLTRDPAHCGRCGNACQAPDCACVDGALVVSCPSGRADCDADPSNGCEVDSATSMMHCGRCQRACHTNGHDAIAAVCVDGACRITCESEVYPEADCDGNPDNGCETSLWLDDMNCGGCGVRCTCNMGVCR